MPVLGADGKPVRVKDWAENRHQYEGRRDRLRNDPNVFAATAAPSKVS